MASISKSHNKNAEGDFKKLSYSHKQYLNNQFYAKDTSLFKYILEMHNNIIQHQHWHDI